MRLNKTPAFVLAAALAASLSAQVPFALPYARSMDLFVVDSSFDGVWRLSDFNQDGDYLDAGEVTTFFSDVGTITLTNPACITCAPDGTVYIADTTVDIVVALRDQNGDGDAMDAGEYRTVFSSTNPGGLLLSSAQGITVDALGRLFLAVANSGSPPAAADMVLRLEDLTGDGDFDDVGEATSYCTIPNTTASTGLSVPTKVAITVLGEVLLADIPSAGPIQKGIYRLFDANFNGNCNDPGEYAPYWTPSLVAPEFNTTPFFFSLAVDVIGAVYTGDHSDNEKVWRMFDADGDGVIAPGEYGVFFQTAGSTWWDIVAREDGAVLLIDAQAPADRIVELRDLDGDGDALDAGESRELYNSNVSPHPISVRGAALMRAPTLALMPPTVQFGTNVDYLIRTAKPNELAVPVFSLAVIPPVALPPFGMLEVDPINSVLLGFGLSDNTGAFTFTLALPNTPSFVGNFGAQALCGDAFRLFLSNSATLIVTP